jgi:hypothetical protein
MLQRLYREINKTLSKGSGIERNRKYWYNSGAREGRRELDEKTRNANEAQKPLSFYQVLRTSGQRLVVPAMRMVCSVLLHYVAACHEDWEVEISWQMASFLRDSSSEWK